jgi:hypothetical protein
MNIDWVALLTSSPALILYVSVALFVFNRIAVAKQIDDQKWEGYIHQAILVTNETGLAPHEPGWLKAATDAFEVVYKKHTGTAPTTQDLSDAATDLARTAGPYVLPALTGLAGKLLSPSVAAPAPAAPAVALAPAAAVPAKPAGS